MIICLIQISSYSPSFTLTYWLKINQFTLTCSKQAASKSIFIVSSLTSFTLTWSSMLDPMSFFDLTLWSITCMQIDHVNFGYDWNTLLYFTFSSCKRISFWSMQIFLTEVLLTERLAVHFNSTNLFVNFTENLTSIEVDIELGGLACESNQKFCAWLQRREFACCYHTLQKLVDRISLISINKVSFKILFCKFS